MTERSRQAGAKGLCGARPAAVFAKRRWEGRARYVDHVPEVAELRDYETARRYVDSAERVVAACRGASMMLEDRGNQAADAARDKIGAMT